MGAAYDAPDEATKAQIANLSVYHSLIQSQARVGHVVKVGDGYGLEGKVSPLRALVEVHPVTKRPSLYMGRHAYEIPGLEPEAAEKLLNDLTTFACQPPRTYKHNWQPGDLGIWDNRSLLHQASIDKNQGPGSILGLLVTLPPSLLSTLKKKGNASEFHRIEAFAQGITTEISWDRSLYLGGEHVAV